MLFLADSVSGLVVNFQSLLGLNYGKGTVTKGEMNRLPELVENTRPRRMKCTSKEVQYGLGSLLKTRPDFPGLQLAMGVSSRQYAL